jgi:predicted TIM-barrel fold metal-dependent hydrolase
MKRPLIAVTSLDKTIEKLARETDKKILAAWAADCAERVLPCFEQQYPEDPRPRDAIKTLREWIRTGVFRMAVIRKASLDAHAAAREIREYDPARSAARSAGQAVATAHAATHSIAAARYAATAVRDVTGTPEATIKEREWQYRHLISLRQKDP